MDEKMEKTELKKSAKDKMIKKDEEITKLQADLNHWKNEYFKAYADMANLRKSMEKDQKDIYKYRIEGFVEDLIPVLDAFDFAFKVEPTNDELRNYLTGFQYVHNQLIQILTNEGIELIEPKIGDVFDLNNMQAVETIDDEGDENIIKKINLKGYRLHEHLIRPAMVVVSKHPAKDEKIEEEIKN